MIEPWRALGLFVPLLFVAACASGGDGGLRTPGGPETGSGVYVFACDDDFRFSIRVHPESVDLRYGLTEVTLPQVIAASGTRYQGEGYTFWSKGLEALLEGPGIAYDGCQGREASTPWDEAGMLGYDFRAVGQEPGWVVEMDFEGRTRVAANYGERRFEFATPDRVFEDRGVTSYTAHASGVDLRILVDETPCTDIMSGEEFPVTARLRIDGEEFSGCGRMVYDQPSSPLASVDWVMTELEGFQAIMMRADGQVTLRFIPAEARALTNTGCNYAIVPFTLMEEQIRFRSAIPTTNMRCAGDALARQESQYLRMLERVSRYEIADSELHLFVGNRMVARFMPVNRL